MGISGNWDRRMNRRRFVALGGVGATALVLGHGPYTEKAVAAPKYDAYPFALGVASGDPAP